MQCSRCKKQNNEMNIQKTNGLTSVSKAMEKATSRFSEIQGMRNGAGEVHVGEIDGFVVVKDCGELLFATLSSRQFRFAVDWS
jgi:hypothetical protein